MIKCISFLHGCDLRVCRLQIHVTIILVYYSMPCIELRLGHPKKLLKVCFLNQSFQEDHYIHDMVNNGKVLKSDNYNTYIRDFLSY